MGAARRLVARLWTSAALLISVGDTLNGRRPSAMKTLFPAHSNRARQARRRAGPAVLAAVLPRLDTGQRPAGHWTLDTGQWTVNGSARPVPDMDPAAYQRQRQLRRLRAAVWRPDLTKYRDR